ncbi:MAG: CPBP family intramembrane metalloprotease [Defluviitaleaceae bacterium]|nr:CPBP family intramembrane metalloprotease [Defluviitaleaceae bacterium]
MEEVGFRGFLGKRLIAKFGFAAGNAVQAAMFGLSHNVIGVYLSYGLIQAAGVFMITGIFGWIAGYITEKKAGGSIVPAWILHAIANIPVFTFLL